MLFAGGPATEGPGMVVTPELREPIRSHHDLEKDTAKHWKKATKVHYFDTQHQFYETIAKRAADANAAIDIFAGCLDQIGLMEMKSLVNLTNGFIVLSDAFNTNIFKQSFHSIFEKDADGFMQMGFNANLDVLVDLTFRDFLTFQTSKDLKVCGLIGPAISTNKKTPNVGETARPFKAPNFARKSEFLELAGGSFAESPITPAVLFTTRWHRR